MQQEHFPGSSEALLTWRLCHLTPRIRHLKHAHHVSAFWSFQQVPLSLLQSPLLVHATTPYICSNHTIKRRCALSLQKSDCLETEPLKPPRNTTARISNTSGTTMWWRGTGTGRQTVSNKVNTASTEDWSEVPGKEQMQAVRPVSSCACTLRLQSESVWKHRPSFPKQILCNFFLLVF